MRIPKWFKNYIDNQYRSPRGIIGAYIGEKMVRQHQPETLWTVDLLQIQTEDKVLELGCGAGSAIKLLLQNTAAGHVSGIDLSNTVIRSAKFRNRRAWNEGKADFTQADLKNLPYSDEHFHKVYSIHTLYFWEDVRKSLTEIFRVLKPGGSFIITLSDGADGEVWEGVKELLDKEFIPMANSTGFLEVSLIRGSNSRQFHTVAVTGKKPS